MVTNRSKTELIAIVGPTASGKSDLAVKVAKEFNGEIICADSRTIYQDMSIGTAKPSDKEQKQVRHWGLDLLRPGQPYSAAKFKQYAQAAIIDIQSRGKLPIIVGGTGLYIDAVLYDFNFSLAGSERDPINPRHLKRTEQAAQVKKLPAGVILVGLMPPDDVLKQRIADRAESMFERGIVDETKGLIAKYGRDKITGTAGIVYKIILQLLAGDIDQEQAIELFKTADWQYARRQKTWFKRNPEINWFNGPDEAYKYVKKTILNT